MKYCSHCGHPNQDGALFCVDRAENRYHKTQKEMALEVKVTMPLIQRLEAYGLIPSMSMWEMKGLQT